MILRKAVSNQLGKPEYSVESLPLWHATTQEDTSKIVAGRFTRGLGEKKGEHFKHLKD